MTELIRELTDPDDTRAYRRTRQIAAVSEASPEYYPGLEAFASLLAHPKSYVRTRAFLLCCCQARWDEEGRLWKLLPELLPLLSDRKPTVVRQCLNAVQELIAFRPELCPDIRQAVEKIDPAQYSSTMYGLIAKDRDGVLELLDTQHGCGETAEETIQETEWRRHRCFNTTWKS